MFERFKKRKKLEKTQEQLQLEYDANVAQYINAANMPAFNFIKDYYEAKVELNRDVISTLNPFNPLDRYRLLQLNAKNDVMEEFILEIDTIRLALEIQSEDKVTS